MWYFAWILGLGLAVAFGILNGIWHEFRLFDEGDTGESVPDPEEQPPAPHDSKPDRLPGRV